MDLMRNIGKFLVVAGLFVLLYDLVSGWFVDATLSIRSVSEWGKQIDPEFFSRLKAVLARHMKSQRVDKLYAAPGFLALVVPGAFIYMFYRLIFAIRGGKTGGYRSRD